MMVVGEFSKMPKTCQVLLFSATFPPQVENFAQRFAPEANVIRLRTEELTVDAIKQYYIDSTTLKDKYSLLLALYGLLTVSQSIIFVQVGVVYLTLDYKRGGSREEIRRIK